MKRITLAAAFFALAACAGAGDNPTADTTTPAMAPPGATTMADSMRPDSAGATSGATTATTTP
mgnify:CR=1 FL=1